MTVQLYGGETSVILNIYTALFGVYLFIYLEKRSVTAKTVMMLKFNPV